jgi:hypothetical protein
VGRRSWSWIRRILLSAFLLSPPAEADNNVQVGTSEYLVSSTLRVDV